MAAERPFWRDDYPRPEDLPTGELPAEVDIAVIGAGITGLSAARRLAKSGADVAVLDVGEVGAGASSVNGGQVNVGLKARTETIFRRYGEALGLEFWQASLRSIDLVEEIVKAEDIDCGFARSGAVSLGYQRRDLQAFQTEAAWAKTTLGFDVEVVGPADIHRVIDSPVFYCALIDRASAKLHPARYVYGLARAAARNGGRIVEHAGVERLERAGSGYLLTTPRGTLAAGRVLIATNGYTDGLVPRLRRGVVPVGSYMVATEPLPSGLADRLMPGNQVYWTARRFLNYFRRSPDDRILMGGRNDLSTDLDLAESARLLGRTIAQLFPAAAAVPLTHTWSGKLAVTFDLMPHSGQTDGVWFALGYGGHGVAIGTYLGDEIGALMAGEIERSPFTEIGFPTRFFYRERAWFLPWAARWYRLLDRLGR